MNQFPPKVTFSEAFDKNEKRKAKIAIQANVHQQEQEANSEKANTKTIDNIKATQSQRRATIRIVNADMQDQRESLQQRLAQRRKRATSKNVFNNSVIETSTGLRNAAGNMGRPPKPMTSSVLKPDGPKEDYVKKIISQSIRGFRVQSDKPSGTPKSALLNKGPQFGQSRINLENGS